MGIHTPVNANKCSPQTESSVAAIWEHFFSSEAERIRSSHAFPNMLCCLTKSKWRLLTTTRRYLQVSQDLECPKSIEARRGRYPEWVVQKFSAKPEPWLSQVLLVADTPGLLRQGPLPRLFAAPFAASRLTLAVLRSTSRYYPYATPAFSKPFPTFSFIYPATLSYSYLCLASRLKIEM